MRAGGPGVAWAAAAEAPSRAAAPRAAPQRDFPGAPAESGAAAARSARVGHAGPLDRADPDAVDDPHAPDGPVARDGDSGRDQTGHAGLADLRLSGGRA